MLIRSLLVPATVSLFGRWDWWLPEPARRVLRLPAAPPVAVPVPGGENGLRGPREATSTID